MAREETIVDSVSGKTRDQLHKEHNEDLESTYKVGRALVTTLEEYEERLSLMPQARKRGFLSEGNSFDCFAMGEPIYHSDFRDPGRCGVAVVTWYFRCISQSGDWQQCFTVNDTLSSKGRSRAIQAVLAALDEARHG